MNSGKNYITVIGVLILLQCTFLGFGQDKAYSKRLPYISSLDQARTLVESQPEEAIILLDGVIRNAIEKNLTSELSEAYLLAGRAYIKLNQPSLAIYYLELSEEQLLPS